MDTYKSFYELISSKKIQIPIIQRDYAQGRTSNLDICRDFLNTIKESLISKTSINLDFVYGNDIGDTFQPLDGQQRLTTLFLLHWYAFQKEKADDKNIEQTLLNFSYQTRLSSRRFCESLIKNRIDCSNGQRISDLIKDSEWYYLSWEQDPTIRAMLNSIDLIQDLFFDVEKIWEALTEERLVTFNLLVLENFGLSDDLYIKMNARGRLLTPFENLKAEIQDKASTNNWETGKTATEKFAHKIDTEWTDFLWNKYNINNSIDRVHMNFISTLIMISVAKNPSYKPTDRLEIVRRINDNTNDRMLIKLIDEATFNYLYDCYELYSKANDIDLNLVMWRHTPNKSILNQIMLGPLTSYTHKVLFYAQTEYLLNCQNFDQEKYNDWMRVIRNIVSRGDVSKEGKRPDIVRSPEAFSGAISLISEIEQGCEDIYSYLSTNTISSNFARSQTNEEIVKAKIISSMPQKKALVHEVEDNELLRGRIAFPLLCAGYNDEISGIDFDYLEKVSTVFKTYFNKELDSNDEEFDLLRRALLTIKVNGYYRYFEYWWSFWNAEQITKRKLFPLFRELEYFIGQDIFIPYFQKLVDELINHSYREIIDDFAKPINMPNWQYRLIKEDDLIASCDKKYIAIAEDDSFCYLLKGKRPSNSDNCIMVS